MGIIAFAYALAYHMSRGDGERKKQTTELSSVKLDWSFSVDSETCTAWREQQEREEAQYGS
jgi:hypothetical protein